MSPLPWMAARRSATAPASGLLEGPLGAYGMGGAILEAAEGDTSQDVIDASMSDGTGTGGGITMDALHAERVSPRDQPLEQGSHHRGRDRAGSLRAKSKRRLSSSAPAHQGPEPSKLTGGADAKAGPATQRRPVRRSDEPQFQSPLSARERGSTGRQGSALAVAAGSLKVATPASTRLGSPAARGVVAWGTAGTSSGTSGRDPARSTGAARDAEGLRSDSSGASGTPLAGDRSRGRQTGIVEMGIASGSTAQSKRRRSPELQLSFGKEGTIGATGGLASGSGDVDVSGSGSASGEVHSLPPFSSRLARTIGTSEEQSPRGGAPPTRKANERHGGLDDVGAQGPSGYSTPVRRAAAPGRRGGQGRVEGGPDTVSELFGSQGRTVLRRNRSEMDAREAGSVGRSSSSGPGDEAVARVLRRVRSEGESGRSRTSSSGAQGSAAGSDGIQVVSASMGNTIDGRASVSGSVEEDEGGSDDRRGRVVSKGSLASESAASSGSGSQGRGVPSANALERALMQASNPSG